MGRYGTSTLPDVTVNPDGTLATLRSYQGLGTLEFHTTKWDIYFNGGGEFVGRHFLLNAAGGAVGYGSGLANNAGCGNETVPGTPVGGQFPDFFQRISARCVGKLRSQPATSSKVPRVSGIASTRVQRERCNSDPNIPTLFAIPGLERLGQTIWANRLGLENMFLTSFRYYLP